MNTNYKNTRFRRNSTQHGATLIEILISIVILAIGMLGMAALQNTSLKFSYDSYLRSQASFLVYDLIDRVRANPDGGPYNLAFNETPDANGKTCDFGDLCDETEMRLVDLVSWRKQTDELLPKAKVDITFDAVQSLYTVRMEWEDRSEVDRIINDDSVETKEFTYSFKVN